MLETAGHRTVVLVSGRGTNLQAILDRVTEGAIPTSVAAVISDRPGAPALNRAVDAGVPALTLDFATFESRDRFETALADLLDELAPDLIALAGFMRVLPATLVEHYAGRMLNVHPSLLPRHRGLHTHRRALEAGDEWHGATVHFVVPALDAGPALIEYRLPVGTGDDEESLRARVQRGEHLIYPRAIGWAAAGRAFLRSGSVWFDGAALAAPFVETESGKPSGERPRRAGA